MRNRYEAIARALVRTHLPEWRVRWTGDIDFFGEAIDGDTIELSLPLAEAGTLVEFLETVLHEIAHGLTWTEKASHGPRWKAQCRRFGIAPRATSGRRGVALRRRARSRSLGVRRRRARKAS